MNHLYFSLQPQSKTVSSSSGTVYHATMLDLALFLFFAFAILMGIYKRHRVEQENSIEAQRQQLERIWKASSSKR